MSSPTGFVPPPLTAEALTLTESVREHLTPGFIRDALTPYLQRYRARKLTIEVVVFCVIELILRGLPSMGALVRRLRLGQLASVAAVEVTAEAFYQRLQDLPHTLFAALLVEVVQRLAPTVTPASVRAALAPFAHGVFAVDDTTLDALARKCDAFARPAPQAKFVSLAGRLGCVVDVTTGLFRAVAYDSDPTSHERHRLVPLTATLPAGALVVLDRGYFAFDLFDALGERFLYFVTRLKDGVVWRVAHTFVATPTYRDQLVWLGGAQSTEAMRWPVRLVEVQVADGTWWRYVTNVWEPTLLPAAALVSLYETRWTIERMFAALKRALGLATLYPCHLNGLLIQIWCTLLLYQLLQGLRTAVATTLAWGPDEVSWPKLMEALTLYAERPQDAPLRVWLEAHAASLELRVERPERRKRVTFAAGFAHDALTTPAALDITALTPQRPRRRPNPYPPRHSERFQLDLFGPCPTPEP